MKKKRVKLKCKILYLYLKNFIKIFKTPMYFCTLILVYMNSNSNLLYHSKIFYKLKKFKI